MFHSVNIPLSWFLAGYFFFILFLIVTDTATRSQSSHFGLYWSVIIAKSDEGRFNLITVHIFFVSFRLLCSSKTNFTSAHYTAIDHFLSVHNRTGTNFPVSPPQRVLMCLGAFLWNKKPAHAEVSDTFSSVTADFLCIKYPVFVYVKNLFHCQRLPPH